MKNVTLLTCNKGKELYLQLCLLSFISPVFRIYKSSPLIFTFPSRFSNPFIFHFPFFLFQSSHHSNSLLIPPLVFLFCLFRHLLPVNLFSSLWFLTMHFPLNFLSNRFTLLCKLLKCKWNRKIYFGCSFCDWFPSGFQCL